MKTASLLQFGIRFRREAGLAILLMAFPGPAENELVLPPATDTHTQRIRIPIADAETAMANKDTGEATEEELAAFNIAADAQGWIPEGSSGIIRNGMMIRVTVMVQGRAELATEAKRINQSGEIGLPLLMNTKVGGMDLLDMENMLTESYKEYYQDPLVSVQFVGSAEDPSQSPWGYVTLMGNVGSPGPISMPATGLLTVSGAVKRAGGVAASANKGSIRIYRPHPEEDTVELIRVDLDVLAKRGEQAEDVGLRAGDVIYIPERIF
ncbi:MAG: polysaccharide biosynthesis/export family protein [Kiritimatiellae bacterium]|jgi:protein involved in polysaccharide export with SLBB domain|nr:polysaccharide biosynthesis/export family protein [Kiritimatiellia bacterium]